MLTKTNQLIIGISGNFSNSAKKELINIVKIKFAENLKEEKVEDSPSAWNCILFIVETINEEKLLELINTVYINRRQLKILGIRDINFSLGIYQFQPKNWFFSDIALKKMAICNCSLSVNNFGNGLISKKHNEVPYLPNDITVQCFMAGSNLDFLNLKQILSTKLTTNSSNTSAAFIVNERNELAAMNIVLIKLYHYMVELELAGVKTIKIGIKYKSDTSSEISKKQIKQLAKLKTTLELVFL